MKVIGGCCSAKDASKEIGIKYKTLIKRIYRGNVAVESFGNMKLVPLAEVERLKREQGR